MSAALRLLPVLPDTGPENDLAVRPRTRGECVGGERPCPWASCTHHAIHGVLQSERGRDLDADAVVEVLASMRDTCTLDVADRGGADGKGHVEGDDGAGTLQAIGELWGCTRERVRQLETRALGHVPKRLLRHLRELLTEEPAAAEARPARCGPVPASESRGWTDPSPRYAHLPGPAEVDAAETEFWCGHMGTALSGRLCTRRHLARHRVSSDRLVKTYPECARCADGAGIAARLGATEAPVPQRVEAPAPVPEITAAAPVPVPVIDGMGGGADAEQLAGVGPDVASEEPAQARAAPEAVHRDVKPAKPRKPRAAPVQRAKVVRVRVRLPEHPVLALVEAFAARARKVRRA